VRRVAVAVLAGVAALLATTPAAVGGGAPQHKTVLVRDDFFLPATLTVNRGSTITWRWPGTAGNVHDVRLWKHPAGVKVFQSEPSAAGYAFRRRLTVPGTYRILCTFHSAKMRMTITVRR
jgi:plastocyanin